MDPLWNSIVIGGVQDGKPFLGTVSMLGVQFSDEHIATGAAPLLCCAVAPHLVQCDALCRHGWMTLCLTRCLFMD